ncbi:MAG TPA: DUF4118 domain-containing protein [Iamia sp.]|nr:DUF4118 domain-containing protein [Iamia sp.]
MSPVPAPEPDDEVGLVAAGGVFAALLVPMVLATVRDEVGQANVALVLAGVVVIAGAAGGRRAGMATSVVAVLAFNFFHTRPYLSFTVDGGHDLLTLGLLLVSGVVASEVAHRSRQAQAEERAARATVARVGRLASDLAHGEPDDVAGHAERLVRAEVGAASVRVEIPVGPEPLPRAHRDGCLDPEPGSRVRRSAALHDGPVAFPITFADRLFGRVVVDASDGVLDPDTVATVAVLVDQVALALARTATPADS